MVQVLVNTGRTIMQGMYVDHKNSRDYIRETAVIRLHPVDMMKLMLGDGEHAQVTVHEGKRDISVVLAAYPDENIVPGHAFIPLGPYANHLVSGDTSSTGMPHFKGILADVIATDLPILTVGELMATCGGTPLWRKTMTKIPEVPYFSKPSGGVQDGVVTDVICPFCGCLCDDIEVTVAAGTITEVENACALGAQKFLADTGRLAKPIRRDGNGWHEISYDEAIEYCVEILKNANRPLLYGWSSSLTETQALGMHIAELIGGVIDSTSTVCHGPSILAIQEVGHPGCTLGQVKNRADVIVYWGTNPTDAHPRHMSRYSTYVDAYFMHNSFRDRKIIVVDVRRTATADIADEFLQITPGGDYALASALRAIVRGRDDVVPDEVSGISKVQMMQVAQMFKNAKFGALFFGLGITMTRGKYKNVRNAIELVDELNRFTKWTITAMRGHWNVYGSNEVFTWISGYPYGIDYSRGIAYYNPGETTSVDLLARREVDAAVIVGSDIGAHFPQACCEHLASIPTVLIDPYPSATTHLSTVQIPTAVNGIDAAAGTAYRMDGIPLHTRQVLPCTTHLTDYEIFSRIYARLKEEKGV